jgi:hypothetical protein
LRINYYKLGQPTGSDEQQFSDKMISILEAVI